METQNYESITVLPILGASTGNDSSYWQSWTRVCGEIL